MIQTPMKRFPCWKPIELLLTAAVAVWLLSGGLALNTQQQLAERVVRLHVLANSDTEADQTIKLQVRDAVMAELTPLLDGITSREEAEIILERSLPALQQTARARLTELGSSDPVAVELAVTEFPTRTYGSFALPAGEYLALRVLIGEAAGQNWWCVAFPPLCAAAVSDVAATALAAGLEERQISLITEEEGYLLRFKTVEWWQQLQKRIGK